MFTLDQAISAIVDKPEFTVRDKGDYVVIDYNFSSNTTFVGKTVEETKILLNLRGTAFDKESDKIIRLGFEKFFNYGEHPVVDANYNIATGHIHQKLDGSCIFPIYAKSGTRLGTRAGVTDISVMAEQWIAEDPVRNENYTEFIKLCGYLNLTPIFEFCSRKNRVVIDHPVDRLVLLSIRSNVTGEYRFDQGWRLIASDYNIEIVQEYNVPVGRSLINWVRQFEGDEGVVVTFDDGHKIKIKSDSYILRHKAVDGLKFEKDVVQLIVNNELDDVLPLLDDSLRYRVEIYQQEFLIRFVDTVDWIGNLYNELRDDLKTAGKDSKKDFAAHVANIKYRSFLFAMYDNSAHHPRDLLSDWIKKTCNSQIGCEKVRQMLDLTHVY